MAVLAVSTVLVMAAGERIRGLLWTSGQVVAVSLAIALPVGAGLAILIVKTDAPGRRAASWILISLLFLPLYVQAAAWDAAIGQLGWWTQASATGSGPVDPLLDGLLGVAWVHGLAAAPWAALIVGAALWAVDRSQEEASLLDASAPRVLLRVTLRHAIAGCAMAAVWIGVQVAAEMTVTDLLQVRTFAEEVYTQVLLGAFQPNSDVPATISVSGMWCGVLLLAVHGGFSLAAAGPWVVTATQSEDGPWRWRPRRRRAALAVLLWAPVLLLILTPIANLAYQAGVTVERTPDGWDRGWSVVKMLSAVVTAPWWHRRDLVLTAELATAVATASVVVGGIWAWAMAGGRAPWLSLLAIACLLTIPGPVLGLGVIHLLNHPWDSPLAWLTWLYDHTLTAPWLVQMSRATPLVAIILWPAFASVPRELLDAAKSDGVGPFGRLLRIAAPVRWRAVAGAWLAGFAASVAELPGTYLVLPPGPETVSKRVFTLLHSGVEDRLAGLCLAMIVFFLLLAAAAALLTKGDTIE